MSTAVLNIPRMKSTAMGLFETMENSAELLPANRRRLVDEVLNGTDMYVIEAQYLSNALYDAAFLTVSAALFGRTYHPEAEQLRLIKASTGLLTLATMHDSSEKQLLHLWNRQNREQGSVDFEHIPLDRMQLADTSDPNQGVTFNHTGLIDMDVFDTPGGGCPVRGIFLNSFYARYVDVVYGPSLQAVPSD